MSACCADLSSFFYDFMKMQVTLKSQVEAIVTIVDAK